ncbi:SusC/RagA family TonB-linked outer membrane protein [Kriegella aquimaris]|uniref:Iron complex outermembrane recepter protein n=1 Tax=Kriegella aquimaris TaxID=192904 RepID=A0A1G9RLQ9_9FLAO|nr:SusC/RagA family TonB-linked outer membrane protein [Kriegella aquimaris]SDM23847.1 iron complex outermembrane recepter protein [Kriegella aquimaris]
MKKKKRGTQRPNLFNFGLKMKLTTILLIVSLFKIQANTYSQNTKITLNLKNVSLEEVFNEIEAKTEFRFLYNNEEVDPDRKVSINVSKKRIAIVLREIFQNTSIDYKVFDNRQIVLSDVKENSTIPDSNIKVGKTVQNQVTGTVTDEDGVPLPGVNVVEKGTSNGASTDFDGNYVITVSDTATLVFSSLGYTTKELAVGSRDTINMVLEEDASQLDEVVVTALGIKKDAKALGYSVAKVDTERILASGTPVNALQSLYGTASGVSVASTAIGPSGGMKINIRNAVSFDENSTTRPLIVVDGVPIHDENTSISYNERSGRDNGTGINDINPDDIASFEILKGAKASVLYGSEGANGVILITTKSGTKGQGLGVSASFTTSMDKSAFMPEFQDQYGTGRSPSNTQTDAQGYYLDDNNQRALDVAGAAFGPKFDPNVNLNWWDGSKKPWVANRQTVYDQLFRTGIQQTANVAVSGGNDKGSMRFSYTNMRLTPVFLNSEYKKNTFSLSSTYKLNDFISVRYVGNYYTTNNLNSAYAGSFDAQGARSSLGAYSRDIDVDLLRSTMVTDNGYNYFSNPDLQSNFISGGRQSVIGTLWDWTQNESIFKRVHSIQSLTLDLTFNDVFTATVLGGLDNTTEHNTYKGKLQDPSLIGPNSGSVYTDDTRNIRKTYGQATFNFDTSIKEFGLSGFVGGAIRNNFTERKGASVIGGMVIPNFFSFSNLPSGVQPVYTFDNGEDMLYSLLGSFQVDWRDQLYVEVQGRQDWSSILPPQNNSYFYPGASVAWIASNSFNLPDVVQFLKLRTSWADVGRPGPRYFSNVNLGVSASGSGFILSPPGDLPPIDDNFVPNLKPERKREYEVGLEAYLFDKRRLGIDFSLYHSNTYDQIMKVTAPPGLGVNNIRLNAGDVANTGWELALKTIPVLGKDFQWNFDMTFAASKTKVERLDGELTSLSLWGTNGLNAVAEVGGEYGVIYQQRGWQNYINPSDDNDPNNGQRIVDGDGARYSYSTSSNRKVGKLLPDVTGGAFSSFNYKNFGLVVNLDYSFGATFIHEAETYMMASGVLNETLQYRDAENGGVAYYLDNGGQKVAGANPGAGPTYNDGVLLNGVYSDGTQNNQVASAEDYYYQSYFSNGFFPQDRLFKSDYVALRNISLTYRLPDLSKRIGLTNIEFSVFANNVAYLYKAAPNTIPESSNGTGWSSGSYGTTALPAQRSVGLSVKAKL